MMTKNSMVDAGKVDEKLEKKEKKVSMLRKSTNIVKKNISGKTKHDASEEPSKTIAERPVRDPYDIIKFVLMTERSIQIIETQNKLSFIVDRRADKQDIKRAAESAFKTPVKSVNTLIDQSGRKRAIVRFGKEGIAGEIAIRLGII